MRADLLLALLLAAPALRASDLGSAVTFRSRQGAQFTVRAGNVGTRVFYESGPSDPLDAEWDTLLIHGELPDPSIRFMASRTAAGAGWVELPIQRFPNGRFWAKASFAKGPGRLQLRAVGGEIKSEHQVTLYDVEVFEDLQDAPSGPALPPRGPIDPAAPAPPIHDRAAWRALPPTQPLAPDPLPWRVTLHHTNGRYTTNLPESLEEARFIQHFHQNGRKWIDIAYHYLVDPNGNILEGRPLETLGAHALGNNDGNVGIVLLGAYHAPANDAPTAAQLASVVALGRFLVSRFGIMPAALKGHRDHRPSACPGDRVYPLLPELRRAFKPAPRTTGARAFTPPPFAAAPDWDGQRAKKREASPSATR